VIQRFADIVDDVRAPDVVAVDMPIGLPDRAGPGGRGPERLVRPLLGQRKSSVFSVPARRAVETLDYRAACEAAFAASDPPRKVSKQTFCLFAKIREIDELLRSRPALLTRVRESHPEVAFWRMNGSRPLAHPKKIRSQVNPAGMAERRRLLREHGLPDALLDHPVPRGAALDDLVDALAVSVVAERILRRCAVSFPDPPLRDVHGLPIAIWA